MKRSWIIILFFCSLQCAAQQQDSIPVLKNSNAVVYPDSFFTFNVKTSIPKKAAFFSAILPGLGQVYNKQYWKLGLVGAGAGAATYLIIQNNREYQKFRNAYIARIDNNPNTTDEFVGLYADNDLNILQQQYRQYLEYTVVFTVVGYTLNILDAYIASNLKDFDLSDDISMLTKPSFENRQIGLALVFKLK